MGAASYLNSHHVSRRQQALWRYIVIKETFDNHILVLDRVLHNVTSNIVRYLSSWLVLCVQSRGTTDSVESPPTIASIGGIRWLPFPRADASPHLNAPSHTTLIPEESNCGCQHAQGKKYDCEKKTLQLILSLVNNRLLKYFPAATTTTTTEMGSAASSYIVDELPERMDLEMIQSTIERSKMNVQIDMVRFNLLKDKDGTISRVHALQLIENKLPPIYSLNCLECRWGWPRKESLTVAWWYMSN